MEFKDYYKTLGVSKSASDEEIKRAYRKLARKHHPDLNPGDKAAEARFKDINEANEVLGDHEKRRKYDELGANWRDYERAAATGQGFGGGAWHGGGEGQATYRTVSPEEMEHLFGNADPFSDFFHTFFGGVSGETAGKRRGAGRARQADDVEFAAELSLEEAFTGTTRQVPVTRHGRRESVEVRIPAGVKDGSRVRVAGHGAAGHAGAAAGDLFLQIRIQAHPRFERRDRDLQTRITIPVTTAVLGGEVGVPTLAGSTLRLKIPASTAAGRVFRLRGHGMPTIGRIEDRGDLYVTIDIQVPTHLTPEEREHYEALRRLAEAARQEGRP